MGAGVTESKLSIFETISKYIGFQTKSWMAGDSDELEEDLIRRKAGFSNSELPSWHTSASNLLEKARDAQEKGDGEQAWLALKAAKREVIRGYSAEEILATAVELEKEAQKIPTVWRREAILEILKGQNSQTPLNHDQLIKACNIRDGYYDSLWRKIDRRRSAIKISLLTLFFIILAILVKWEFFLNLSHETSITFMGLWGALGASLTATFSLINSELPDKFTEGAMNRVVTACRPFIGAASAIVVLVFINADFISVGTNPMAAYATGFLSGFSEKFFFSVISKERKKTE